MFRDLFQRKKYISQINLLIQALEISALGDQKSPLSLTDLWAQQTVNQCRSKLTRTGAQKAHMLHFLVYKQDWQLQTSDEVSTEVNSQ